MKARNLKFTLALGPVMFGIAGGAVYAGEEAHNEDRLEEIVVTAPFEESEAETMLPIGILSGEALLEKVGNSLGDTLKNEIGVNSASFGTGVDHIDLAAAKARGITVTNTPGVLTEDTADVTMALILAVPRRIAEGDALARSGKWQGWSPTGRCTHNFWLASVRRRLGLQCRCWWLC